ncbi:hypothetical protein HG66A1_47840 [Gimesia chilikensis]|uniref:Uncharacterized protein n=2 Tax=Gimesia chilikensis TaxID=2605989 RepID=A0A517PUC2_9PLAN|nr:hypothetical protein HG66A1_47840 [Gimesia chilikensis]
MDSQIVNMRNAMTDSDLSPSELREQFKAAATRYDFQVLLRGAIAFVSFFLTLALLAFVVKYFRPEIHNAIGIKAGTADCPNAINPILILPMIIISACFPVPFLYRQVKQLRQTTAPRCPFCQISWRESERKVAAATGFCPICQQQMFEGEINSAAAAVENYEKTKSETRRFTRFTFYASLGGLMIVLPVYLWLYFTDQLPGKNPLSLTQILFLFPLLFAFISVGLWWAGRSSVREQQNILELFRAGERKSVKIEVIHCEQESQQ